MMRRRLLGWLQALVLAVPLFARAAPAHRWRRKDGTFVVDFVAQRFTISF